MHTSNSRVLAYTIIFLVAVGATFNCAGGGCQGCEFMEPIPGGFPSEKRIENGIQVRVTSDGIQFLEDNLDTILADMMPDGLIFQVPPKCDQEILFVGILDLCGQGSSDNCVADDPPCLLELEILDLSLTPSPPASIDIVTQINFWSLETMHTYGLLSSLDCDIEVDTRLGSQPYVTAVAEIEFIQDSESNRTRAALSNVDIPDGEIEGDDLSISGGLTCSAIDTFFKNTVIDRVKEQMSEKIEEMMLSTCVECDPDAPECPEMSSCQEVVLEDNEGNELFYYYCFEDTEEGCVQAMGTDGRIDLGALLYSLSPGSDSAMDIHARAGGYSSAVNEGMSLGMLSGAMGSPVNHPCVPAAEPPEIVPAPRSTSFESNTRPDGASFQMGMGMHKSVLNAAGYALYDSGTLCMEIGPRQSSFLTVGTFGALLDSLNDLVKEGDPAVVLSLRPKNPLTFELGSGTTDENGDIEEPLITVKSQELAIDFYALIDYRFIRIFRIIGDLSLPLNLEINEFNQLVPVLGDLQTAFENVRAEESPLLAEDPEEIAAVFPILMDTASGMLGEDLLAPIEIPVFAGFQLLFEEGSIASVDNNTFLAIYANLNYVGVVPEEPSPFKWAVKTTAELKSLKMPRAEDFRAKTIEDTLYGGPVAVLSLDAALRDMESQFQSNPHEEFEFSYRLNGGPWSPYFKNKTLEIQRPALWLKGVHEVEVKGRIQGRPESADPSPAFVEIEINPRMGHVQYADDENIGSSEKTVGLYGRVDPPPSSGCGCSFGDKTRTKTPLLFLLLIFGLPFIRSRKRCKKQCKKTGKRAFNNSFRTLSVFFLLSGPAFFLSLGCGGKSSGNKECGDAAALPLICAEPIPDCEIYEDLVGLEEMSYDPKTCDPVPVPCECHAEEIDPGSHGRFLSMAEHEGRILISCYSDQWGDLNVVEVDSEGNMIPEAIDGVPFGTPPSGDPEGFRAGLARRGEDVGQFTDIAFDSEGTAHISYLDLENLEVKYAKGLPDNWEMHHIEGEENKTEHQESVYTAVLLDDNDIPHIFFMVTGLEAEGGNSFKSELRLAVASSSAPQSSDDWTITVIDETPIPCGGFCPEETVCLPETWTCVTEETGCEECEENQVCYSGECTPIMGETTWTDLHEGIGLFIKASQLSDGRMVAVYYDRSAGVARLAHGHPNETLEVLTLEGDEFSDVGLYPSIAVDAQDSIHISYHDSVHDTLVYRLVNSAMVTQAREIVDDGERGGEYHVVGLDSKIFIGDNNNVRIFYQDGTTADLWEAVRTTDSGWSINPLLSGETGYGFFTDVVKTSDGRYWAAEYRYDRGDSVFGNLYVWEF